MSTALRAVPISQDWSDAELVAAVRRGDDIAFAELYSRYSHRIGAYVHGMVGDHGRAEDITQEIFIAALRRMRATERPIAFKAWIYEIAKNACIDNFRRSRRTQEVSLDADDTLSSADRGRLTAVTTMDAALAGKQALDDLRGAFGGLSESHHEILVLRELEGRSYSDIGERLGMSRPVVESTLFRARRRLAEEYDELTSGRRCEFVRKMVDSGPHYSLGIRDRRRMARHFAHCQPCRAHARRAGFDESILNMPSVAAKIAALLPFPLLRARWGAFEHGLGGATPARPSLLAFRSVHTLARSSDQLVGAGSGAGRGAATAAAIVLAGVGGGIATVTSYEPAQQFRRSEVQVASGGRASASVSRARSARESKVSTARRAQSATSAHAGSFAGLAGRSASHGAKGPRLARPGSSAVRSTTMGTKPAVSGETSTGGGGDPAGAGAGSTGAAGGNSDSVTSTPGITANPTTTAPGMTTPSGTAAGLTAAPNGGAAGVTADPTSAAAALTGTLNDVTGALSGQPQLPTLTLALPSQGQASAGSASITVAGVTATASVNATMTTTASDTVTTAASATVTTTASATVTTTASAAQAASGAAAVGSVTGSNQPPGLAGHARGAGGPPWGPGYANRPGG